VIGWCFWIPNSYCELDRHLFIGPHGALLSACPVGEDSDLDSQSTMNQIGGGISVVLPQNGSHITNSMNGHHGSHHSSQDFSHGYLPHHRNNYGFESNVSLSHIAYTGNPMVKGSNDGDYVGYHHPGVGPPGCYIGATSNMVLEHMFASSPGGFDPNDNFWGHQCENYREDMKLPLGEQGRTELKTAIRDVLRSKPELREQINSIAKLKCATIPQLLKMAHLCGIWPTAIDISARFTRSREVKQNERKQQQLQKQSSKKTCEGVRYEEPPSYRKAKRCRKGEVDDSYLPCSVKCGGDSPSGVADGDPVGYATSPASLDSSGRCITALKIHSPSYMSTSDMKREEATARGRCDPVMTRTSDGVSASTSIDSEDESNFASSLQFTHNSSNGRMPLQSQSRPMTSAACDSGDLGLTQVHSSCVDSAMGLDDLVFIGNHSQGVDFSEGITDVRRYMRSC